MGTPVMAPNWVVMLSRSMRKISVSGPTTRKGCRGMQFDKGGGGVLGCGACRVGQ